MKHNIKQFIILALMLVGNTAVQAAEKTYTLDIDGSGKASLVYNESEYVLSDDLWWSKGSATVEDITITIDYGTKAGAVRLMLPFLYAWTLRNYWALDYHYDYTVTVSSLNKYIKKIKLYNTLQHYIISQTGYSNTKSASMKVDAGSYIFKMEVTVSDEQPLFDINNAKIEHDIAYRYDWTGSTIVPTIGNITVETGTSTPGTLQLDKDIDYTVSYENNDKPGKATVKVTANEAKGYTGTWSRSFDIIRPQVEVTAPTPLTVAWNGTPQALCSEGSVKGGSMYYYDRNGRSWSTVPTATNVGSYNVNYRVEPDEYHNGSYSYLRAGTATITPGTVNYGCLTIAANSATDVALTIGESDGTSTDDISVPIDIAVTSVTMDRTFTVGKAATVMLPFDIAVQKVSGGTFYGFVGVDKSGSNWEVVMHEVNRINGTLQAHTPYLFMPTAEKMTFDLGGKTVTLKANSEHTYTVQP